MRVSTFTDLQEKGCAQHMQQRESNRDKKFSNCNLWCSNVNSRRKSKHKFFGLSDINLKLVSIGPSLHMAKFSSRRN